MVYEPMTLLTDALLGGWALILGVRLLRIGNRTSCDYWGWGLVVTAAAAFMGGVWHGFSPSWQVPIADGIWRLVLVLIGVADALFGLAAVQGSVLGVWQRRLQVGVIAKGTVYLGLLYGFDDFWVAVADYLPTLLLILALQIRRLRRSPAARWLSAGVIVALSAAVVQGSGLALHRWFNHNDLYHLLQGAALYGFYRGARLHEAPLSKRT
ncbi:MAG: hypothetical protein C0624_06010 [Desulfuromonas sp.]|nr:MAG: hypothetical protein C0624_06010 [Desulfuromonas sp.]